MRIRIILSLIVASLFLGKLTGQEEQAYDLKYFQGITLDFGSGIYASKMRDELFSPLMYKGITPIFPQGEISLRHRKIQIFSAWELGYGMLMNNQKSEWIQSPGLLMPIYVNTGFLFKVKHWKEKNRHLWFGLNANFNSNFIFQSKLGNSSFNYNTILGSSILGRFEIPFGWQAKDFHIFNKFTIHRNERKLLFAWQLEYPFLGILMRPSFDGIFYPIFDNPKNGSILDSENINFYLFKPIYLRSHLEVSYLLKNRNRLKLSYNWNYFHYTKYEQKATTISYGFLFSYVFAF